MGIFDRFKADRTTQEELTAKEWYDKGMAVKSSKEAIRCFDKALEIDPQFGVTWRAKGAALYKSGRFKEAIRCFDKALEINPKDVEVWISKAGTFLKLSRYQEVIQCCDKALEIDPNPHKAVAWTGKGDALALLGRPQEAIPCYDKALKIDPKYTYARESKKAVLAGRY